MLIDEDQLRDASRQELIDEHNRLRQQLVMDNSAVKDEDDLLRSLTMEFIRNLLKEMHGLSHGEAIKLDNPDNNLSSS